MNKLLNELRIQAGIGRLEDGPWLAVIDKEANVIDPLIGLEKFAELIIRECVAVVGHFEYGPDGEQGEFAMDVLRQHFGVE